MSSPGGLSCWPVTLMLTGLVASGGAFAADEDAGRHAAGKVVRPSEQAVVHASTAALLLSGQTGGDLRIAVRAAPASAADASSTVVVQVEVDSHGLLVEAPTGTEGLELFVYVLDEQGQISASSAERIPLHSQPDETPGLILVTTVDLLPGRYQVRALVRDEAHGRFGLGSATLDLGSGVRETAVWALERRADWLIAMSEETERHLPPAPMVGDARHLPSALPVWVPGSPALLWGQSADGWEIADLQISLRSADGRATAALPPPQRPPSQHVGPGGLFELSIPSIPEGRYELNLSWRGSPEPPVRLQVLIGDPTRGNASWTDFGSEGEFAADPDPAGTPTAAVDLTALADGYREVIDDLIGNDRGRATEKLRALETSAHTTGYDAIRWLEKSQWGLAANLSRTQDLLPALFLLHLDQVEYYRDERQFLLAEHSLRLSEQFVRAMARRAKDPTSATTAARALALLGDLLYQSGRIFGAQAAFDDALALDSGLELALMATAIGQEQTGNYPEAVAALRRLAEVDSGDYEALLRLGVNLGRTGREARALELLDRVAASSADSWIRLVAVQEATALDRRAGRIERALERLREAELAWPESQTIKVSIAYLLDRRNQPGEAERLLDELAEGGSSLEPAARHIYSGRPRELVDRTRQMLAHDAAERLDGGSRE